MVTWMNRRMLGVDSLFLGVIGYSVPWAWFGWYEDSLLRSHVWTGWQTVGSLFSPGVSPLSPPVAVIELFPLIAAVVVIALPAARSVWWWAVAVALSLLSLGYHIWYVLDSAQGLTQSSAPIHVGPSLYVVAVGIAFLVAALWPWPLPQPQRLSTQE